MLNDAFKKIICRAPTDKEIKILSEYWNDKATYFKNNQAQAKQIINVGQYKPTFNQNDALAAFMQVIQIIYNMEEAITKS
jgi:hypothetical protein